VSGRLASLEVFAGQTTGAIKSLDSDISLTLDSYNHGPSTLGWNGASIETIERGGINLLGMNSLIRNTQGGGGTALALLRRISSQAILNLQQHHLNLAGNLGNNGDIILGFGAQLNVAGTISDGMSDDSAPGGDDC